jgi:hypothetical protein
MLYRSKLALLCLLILLSACGRPDTFAPAASTEHAPTTAVTAVGQDIANLLRDPPAANTPVELDVYNWVGQERQAGYNWDDQHCPELASGSLFTDHPIPEALGLPNGIRGNRPLDYPPDTEAWLIPMFAGMIPSYPAPADSAPLLRDLGYYLRIRGHLGDSYFARCTQSKRIFVIDAVVTIYKDERPYQGIMGATKAPADYKQWARYAARAQGLSFPARADWKIAVTDDPNATAALDIQLPQQPDYPIRVRVYPGAPTKDMLTHSILYERTMLWHQLGLPDTSDNVTTYMERKEIDAHSALFSVFFTKDDKTYDVSLTYPLGFYADTDLLETYIGVVAGFQVDE